MQTCGSAWQTGLEFAARVLDDVEFVREVDEHTVPHWSAAWPRINELSRRGMLRVRPINRWMAEVRRSQEAEDRMLDSGGAPA